MTSTRPHTLGCLPILTGYILTAALSPQSAPAQSSTNGDPFLALQRQVEQNSTQLEAANAQIQGFQTDLEAANAEIQELQTQLENANTQIQQCKSQITDLTQTVVGQQEFIDGLVDRMLFDDGEWVGLREMTLVGPTRFTDADGALKVEIAGPASGVVTIFGPDDPGPAIVSWGQVWVAVEENERGLHVYGSARIDGPAEGDALRVSGQTRLVSHEPDNQYKPALDLVGPAWFRQEEQGAATVVLNGGGDSPGYVGRFLGPCTFADADENRWLALFRHPRRPILLERFEDTPHIEHLFYVELPHGDNRADVHANSFSGRTMHAENMFADSFITIDSP